MQGMHRLHSSLSDSAPTDLAASNALLKDEKDAPQGPQHTGCMLCYLVACVYPRLSCPLHISADDADVTTIRH
jgi:hypothetical protein